MDNTTQDFLRNCSIESKGGNQYKVTFKAESKIIDLDGYTMMSDDDYNMIQEAGLIQDEMMSPQFHEGDLFWLAAAKNAANYSGFDVEEYIAENQEA